MDIIIPARIDEIKNILIISKSGNLKLITEQGLSRYSKKDKVTYTK